MMKTNKYILLALASLALFSCDDDTLEDVRNAKPVISVDKNSITVSEGEEITFTATISQEIANSTDLKLEFNGGGASFRDYEVFSFDEKPAHETTIKEDGFGKGSIGHVLVFPALTKTATFKIKIKKDALFEKQEVLNIIFKSTGNMLSTVDPASSNIQINIKDLVNDAVGAELKWDQNTTDTFGTITENTYTGVDGKEHLYTDTYDFDLYIFDASFNDVSGNSGATGSSPEFSELLASRPDGDYFVYVDLYGQPSGLLAPAEPFAHNLRLDLSKYNVWGTKINIPTTSDDTFSNVVAVITKTGNTYVVTDASTSEVIASGRTASFQSRFKAAKKIKN